MNKATARRLGILLVVALLRAPSANASSIALTPSTASITVGANVAFNVEISAILDLYAYQFSVTFDPTILQAAAPTEGSFLPSGGATIFFPGFVDNVGGTLTFVAGTLQGLIPGVSGAGTLALLGFNAIAPGNSAISILLDPANGDVLLDSSLAPIDASVVGARVTVAALSPTAVPEPGTLLLLATGAVTALRHRPRHVHGA
jgi:hypothetical protein